MDSFPEIRLDIVKEYIRKIKNVTKKFISINHEGEKYTMRELFLNDLVEARYSRSPFWLRKGYVKEVFEFV